MMDRAAWQTDGVDRASSRLTLLNIAAHHVLTGVDTLGGT